MVGNSKYDFSLLFLLRKLFKCANANNFWAFLRLDLLQLQFLCAQKLFNQINVIVVIFQKDIDSHFKAMKTWSKNLKLNWSKQNETLELCRICLISKEHCGFGIKEWIYILRNRVTFLFPLKTSKQLIYETDLQ